MLTQTSIFRSVKKNGFPFIVAGGLIVFLLISSALSVKVTSPATLSAINPSHAPFFAQTIQHQLLVSNDAQLVSAINSRFMTQFGNIHHLQSIIPTKSLSLEGIVTETASTSYPYDESATHNYLKQLDNSGLVRASIALNFNGEELHTASQGCLDTECSSKPTQLTRYRIGSITKTFTAVLIMKAVEELRLTLDTPLTHFFPYERYPIKNSHLMTIRLLLNHRSGLYSYTDAIFDLYKSYTLDDIIQIIITHQDTQPEPDTQGSYCNTGYYFLGAILEQLYTKSFSNILNEKILSPLSLYSTYVSPRPHPQISTQEGVDIDMSQNIPENSINQSRPDVQNGETLSFSPYYNLEWFENPYYSDYTATAAAGAIISTPRDLSAFFYGVFIKRAIISFKSIQQMRQYQTLIEGLNYGFGIFEITVPGKNGELHQGFGHNGVVDGFLSYAGIICKEPKSKQGVDVLTHGFFGYFDSVNAFNGSTPVGTLIVQLFQSMLGTPIIIPLAPNQLDPYTDMYDKFAGEYTSADLPDISITVYKRMISRELYNQDTKKFEMKTISLLTLYPQDQIEFPIIFDSTAPAATYIYDNQLLKFFFDPQIKDVFIMTIHTSSYVYSKK